MRESMIPEFLLSVPHLEHPSLQQAHIHHRLLSMLCTQLTHSAQQQQHAAHHNGYHDGQLAAAKLHFGDGVTKVPNLHLEGERATRTHETGPSDFKTCLLLRFLSFLFSYGSHHYLYMLQHISSCHIYSFYFIFIFIFTIYCK